MNNGVEILIAEDSPTQAERLKQFLEESGYTVTVAANGKEALAEAKKRKPALIISDIVMPVMDGYTFCKKVKSDETLKDTPVVLLTGLSSPQDVINGLECNADNFIRKPYDERYLLSRIKHILTNRELRNNQRMQPGVMIYLAGQKHFITSERQQILDLLISTYEQAVHINKELSTREQELSHANQWLTGLYQIAKGLNQSTSEQQVVEEVLGRTMNMPGIQAGWIVLREGETGFRIASARGLPPALQVPGAMEGDCLCRRQLLSCDLNQVTNILECERLQKGKGDTRGLRYHASVPLRIGDWPLGILNLVAANQGLFSDESIKILNGVGNQIGIALERARLHEHLERKVEERTAALTIEIAERTRAEEALRKANDTLNAAIQASPMGITILDADGNVKLWNPAAERIFGWRQEEVIGRPLPTIPPDKREEHRGLRERVLRGEGFSGVDVIRQKKDGSPVDISLSTAPLRDAKGDIWGAMGIMADITERKRAEATQQALYLASLQIQEPLGLRQRLDRLLQTAQTVLELDRVNILLADPEGRELRAVASLGVDEPLDAIRVPIGPEGGGIAQAYLTQQMIAWDGQGPVPEELRLKPPYDRIEAFRSQVFANVPLVVQGRAIGVLGADRRHSRRPLDPATRELLQLFAGQAALAIEHGRLYEEQRLAAIQLEATVEARTRELKATNLRLEEASRHKSEFLAHMSHELRTPLNSVIGFSELLQDPTHGSLNEKQARYAQNILVGGQHLLALINDLLDLSKVEAGKLDLHPETFSLPDAIKAAFRIIWPQAEAKQQVLELQVADDLPTIRADLVRFKQILSNLLSNAVKFTPDAGRITVTAQRGSRGEGPGSRDSSPLDPTPHTFQSDEFVELAVQDTGIGITPEDLPKLFQSFTQLEQTFTKSAQGTGLGLALTKHLVELHGGTIWAESAGEGRGSTFTIRLPLGPPGETRRGEDAHAEPGSTPRPGLER